VVANDSQSIRAQPTKLGDCFFAKAFAEERPRLRPVQIPERQNRQAGTSGALLPGSVPNRFRLSNETVSPAGERLHEAGLIRAIAERGPQSSDCRIQAMIEVDRAPARPQSSFQIVACHHLAVTLKQHDQHLKRLTGQADEQTILAQLVGPNVQRERAETEAVPNSYDRGARGSRPFHRPGNLP
jgi:hypothetical protein